MLHRRFRVTAPVLAWFHAPSTTDVSRAAFAHLLHVLDSDPIRTSIPLLDEATPGQRRARFDGHLLDFTFDPSFNSLRLLRCRRAD